jgi:alpha-L-arabinofuranosidase
MSDYADAAYIWESLMAQTLHWEELALPDLLAAARAAYADRTIDVAITEWGILGPAVRPQVGNLGGAVYAGLFLNFAIRQSESIRVANATALLHGGCIRRAGPFVYRDPQVEVIERYTALSRGRALPVFYEGPVYDVTANTYDGPTLREVPYLDAVAVQCEDGARVVAVVNRSACETIEASITLDAIPGTVVGCDVLTGAGYVDVNTPLAPDKVRFEPYSGWSQDEKGISIALPARSVMWITFG